MGILHDGDLRKRHRKLVKLHVRMGIGANGAHQMKCVVAFLFYEND
jgi:hypothetical protein